MADAPFFIQGDGVDALAEYSSFLDAVGEAASHLLAEFVDIQENSGMAGVPAKDLNATQVVDLYCRHLEGWVVFYVARASATLRRPKCRIGIVHVGSLNQHSFGALESEAETRLREYGS